MEFYKKKKEALQNGAQNVGCTYSIPANLLKRRGLVDLLKNMNDAMKFIEKNFTNEIDFKTGGSLFVEVI
jgi:hypothetical protein